MLRRYVFPIIPLPIKLGSTGIGSGLATLPPAEKGGQIYFLEIK